MGKKSKKSRTFPANDPGCDPVQRKYSDGSNNPSLGGGVGPISKGFPKHKTSGKP